MFELSHRLIGIYKTANATRSTRTPVVTDNLETTVLTAVCPLQVSP